MERPKPTHTSSPFLLDKDARPIKQWQEREREGLTTTTTAAQHKPRHNSSLLGRGSRHLSPLLTLDASHSTPAKTTPNSISSEHHWPAQRPTARFLSHRFIRLHLFVTSSLHSVSNASYDAVNAHPLNPSSKKASLAPKTGVKRRLPHRIAFVSPQAHHHLNNRAEKEECDGDQRIARSR